MKKIKNLKLDAEEKKLSDSFDKGEWKSVKNLKIEMGIAKKAAKNTLRKDARINIRLSSSDLIRIKQKAAFEGMPYQTLIASILHKYAAGHPNK
ncbi:MAG: CopG family antitoxin [Gammaproteobacteria bacterium]